MKEVSPSLLLDFFNTPSTDLADRREALADCLSKLPSRDRELVKSCYAGTQSVKDLAAGLGRTANAIYKRLKFVRRQLFDCITKSLADGAR